jgi:hypothetical protein
MSHTRVARVSRQVQGTYPYSVIPGGVRDVADLQEHAARDYVVRRHFARFDYRHARLIRSDKARQVYLSYRLRDRIFWTRKKVRLLQAELLLTDGNITARARCGNQISETPKAEVSEEEPAEEVLDQPVADIEPIGPALPFRFPNVRPNIPGADAVPPAARSFSPVALTSLRRLWNPVRTGSVSRPPRNSLKRLMESWTTRKKKSVAMNTISIPQFPNPQPLC